MSLRSKPLTSYDASKWISSCSSAHPVTKFAANSYRKKIC
jgi:hypothetical protein